MWWHVTLNNHAPMSESESKQKNTLGFTDQGKEENFTGVKPVVDPGGPGGPGPPSPKVRAYILCCLAQLSIK